MNLNSVSEMNLVTKEREIQELKRIIVGYNHIIHDIISGAINAGDTEVESQLCHLCPCDCDNYPDDWCVYRMLRSVGASFLGNQTHSKEIAERSAAALFNRPNRVIDDALGENHD